MNAPRSIREALVAESLGNLDDLLKRVEALPALIENAEKHITQTVAVLNGASDKYRLAINVFNEETIAHLNEYMDRRSSQVSSKTMEEQRAAIQSAALTAFRTEAFEKAAGLGVVLRDAALEFNRSKLTRIVEYGVTAMFSSALTGLLVYAITKHSG